MAYCNRFSIPDTDLEVSPIGFGTVDIGLKKTDMKDIVPVLETYIELGGNVIDSARIYSDWVPPVIGRSEMILGKWIKERGHHDDFILMTKGGHPRLEDMHTPRMSRSDMQGDIELSLKALGVECIDVYFYHRDDTSVPAGAFIEIMEDFRKQGKIRYYACSNWTTERMLEADRYAAEHGYRGFVANEMLYNIGQKYKKPDSDDTLCEMDESMIAYHRTGRNLAIPYFGMCSGFFHKLASKGVDAVADSPYYTPGNLRVMECINRICAETGASISQAVLGFFLTRGFPVVPLAGASSIDHLKDAMETLDIDFTAELYDF